MTALPLTIGQEQTIATAEALLSKHRFRHLPVLHGGALVGVISDRDVALATRWASAEATVEEAMSPEPYTVHPDADLAEVAEHMASHRLGSAVVVDATGHVVGIFTTVDAMRALGDCLRSLRGADSHERTHDA